MTSITSPKARKHTRVYKTASELGITEAEKRVLVLARNWLRRAPPDEYCPIKGNGEFKFEMGCTLDHEPNECPSAGCIWGLCHIIAKAQKIAAFATRPLSRNAGFSGLFGTASTKNVSSSLEKLFFPGKYSRFYFQYDLVMPSDAAQAIDGFLRTGQVVFPG